ncbi:hypothetical protein AB833_31480 [Chromatiales bacterium (ex Bugula neritina AB1)]|nr:hypothetical protein AB833_31480 [Chromatiales bacterium (ex Bugula neritina AB1)]
MKIAYLLRVRPDLEDIIPPDVESVRIEVGDNGLYSDEDLAKIQDAEAFIVGMEPVNEQILSAAPALKIVQRLGVGFETLDLEATAKRGIPACNLEGVNKEAVAEHCLALMLNLAKRLPQALELTQQADWGQARLLTTQTRELFDKTLGIIGFGNTGSALAQRAHAFGMKLLYNDTGPVDTALAESFNAAPTDKQTLYQQSDFVCICTDLNETSRNMISTEALQAMGENTTLICCARGGIVDEPALATALKEKSIAAAAIDVFEVEPIRADNPLIGLENCLLTSHVAGVAHDTTMRIWNRAHDNVRAVIQKGQKPRWIRNGL